jgi:transposase InsO family protein
MLRNWITIKNSGGAFRRFSPTERKKMVETYLASGMTASEFSKVWGVSGATLGNWARRYRELGSDGLMNQTKNFKRGMSTPKSVQDDIAKIKRQEPSYGIKKIKHWMYRFRGVKVSAGTVRKTVTNEGLPLATRPKKKRKSSDKVRRFERAKPMQLWQSDITQFTLGPSSMRVYLTVFMDDHSRYIVGWRLQSRQTADLVMDAFKDAVVRFGKPQEVLTDQGRQYFAWRGKSDLEKYLEKEGIKHVVSRAHHPQTLGKCERFWETIGNEFWTRRKPQDLDEARIRLKYFIDHYNHQRPHQGLDGSVPADRFFGVAEEVREIIEKTVEANSLRLSLGELAKPPAFLIGQVGDQRIAFHGSSGGFYLTSEDLRGEKNGESISEPSGVASVREYAIGNAKESSPRTENNVQCEVSVPEYSGAWVVGQSESRGASPGKTNSNDNASGMDWNDDEVRGCKAVGASSGEILADEQSGHEWNDGGMFNAAAAAQEGGAYGKE